MTMTRKNDHIGEAVALRQKMVILSDQNAFAREVAMGSFAVPTNPICLKMSLR